jgi:molybdopterin molybdotransferase
MERILSIRDDILRAVDPLPAEEVTLAEARGRYLACDALARLASPPYDCSAMDGFAVRAGEAGKGSLLRVVQTLFAGDEATRPLGPREAARIFTGAPLPPGADAVAMQEVVRVDGETARIEQPLRQGENVRRLAEDLAAGALALPAGTRLGARQLALLAAVGVERTRVHRRPRVAVLATGDEIVRGRAPDSNGPAVAGVLRAAGAEVTLGAVGDRLDRIAGALREAIAAADAVVTIGGVSVGDRDHVPAAVAQLGAEKRVHGVPMKPGKPFLFALAGGKPILGLPGSPSACLVALEVFARPAILRLAGAARTARRVVTLSLAAPVANKPGRAHFVWACTGPGDVVIPLGRDSAQVRGPALADALIRIPEASVDLPAGAEVEAWLLDDDA